MNEFKVALLFLVVLSASTAADKVDQASLRGCAAMITGGLLPIASERSGRFQAKVAEATALCRGGLAAVQRMNLPWVDWGNYFGAGDASSRAPGVITSSGPLAPTARGVRGALLDLEYQRIELITFNLFDNSGAFRDYVAGRNGVAGPAIKTWESMRLSKDHPNYPEAGGDARQQQCTGELVRKRTLTGICNDIFNPLMGSSGQLFARNVEFDAAFPELGLNQLTRNRHGNRLGLAQAGPASHQPAPLHARSTAYRSVP